MVRSRGTRRAARAAKVVPPAKALPVTLLSGFLGSGKTTLLQHVLRSEHGLRIAVVVNDIGAINVDASLIKQMHRITQTGEKVISLQNGCICCTLRGDLLEELVKLSQMQKFDYIIIESSGISEPEQVAETFDLRLAEQMTQIAEAGEASGLDGNTIAILNHIKDAGGLGKFARLDTTVTVIDAFTILNDFDTDELLSSRRDDVTAEDERTVSDLMVDQIEFADVIILNKLDIVDPAMKPRILDLITQLNHRAKVIEATFGKVPVKEIVNTGMFSLEQAQTGYGWLQDLHAMTVREVNGRNVVTPKPETEEYNVGSFIYSRARPFHPRRLFALLHDKLILQMEQDDDDDDEWGDDGDVEMTDSNDSISDGGRHRDRPSVSTDSSGSTAPTVLSSRDTKGGSVPGGNSEEVEAVEEDPLDIPPNDEILENKRRHPLFSRLFRSKGEFFLATRPHRAGDWSQAGAMLTLTGGRPWFCTIPAEDYTTGDDQIDALVKHDIIKGGEWGDRRQELVFIGEKLDHAGLQTILDQCLLTDSEFADWERVMRDSKMQTDAERTEALEEIFDDGFPDWLEDEGHDGNHAAHSHT